MRTDIKIAVVAVALVLIIVLVGWNLVSNSEDKTGPETTDTQTQPLEPKGDTDGPDIGIPSPPDDAIGPGDAIAEIPGVPTTPEEPTVAPAPPSDTIPIGVAPEPEAAPESPAGVVAGIPEAPEPASIAIPENDIPGIPVAINPNETAEPARRTTLDTIVPSGTVSPVADRTHKIEEGETLTVIAEKLYGPGNGKYWTKIIEANPGLNPRNLTVGKVIKIPALVRETSRTASVLTTDSTLPGGQKIYVVKTGDTLSGIAARADVYGSAGKWRLIAEANRNINPNALRVGTKLIIPPLEASTPARTPVASASLAPGQSVYTVSKGDNGLWGVAQKKLGNGKYWPAIAKANPNINPSRLKPGQKLVIPSLEEARKMISPGSSATPRRPASPRRPATPPAEEEDYDGPVFD